MNAICLLIDRLHAGHVGAYGNSWIETPAIDRLASESFTADHFLIDSPRLDTLYRSYWHGEHALGQEGTPNAQTALPELLARSGVTPTLLTDEPTVARHPSARGFDDIIEIPQPEYHDAADQVDQTHLGQCFARAIDWIDSAREPFLLWSHFGALGAGWDAPLEFRLRYAEPEDPDPPESVEVPCRMLQENYDPDELLGFSQAYAGQVSLLDTCLAALMEYLDSAPCGQDTLLMLLSSRGFPLGEHRRVGDCDGALFGELLHVPLLIRFPDRQGMTVRSQGLVHPADIWATLLDSFGLTDLPSTPAAASMIPLVSEETEMLRDRLCVVGDDRRRAIRTPAWYLRDGETPELFAKPDDRWEVNDVANRCGDVVERLRSAFDAYRDALSSGRLAELPPLDDILLSGL